MTHVINFIQEKALSENSWRSYQYDLKQFLAVVGEEMTSNKLMMYEHVLADFKPTVRKRKRSTVNQFLYYLYRKGITKQFYKLENHDIAPVIINDVELIDLSFEDAKTSYTIGQILALLILELGLSPSEILSIQVVHVEMAVQALTVEKSGMFRVLSVPTYLLRFLEPLLSGTYLFEHRGKPYSRQWLFTQLKLFLEEQGYPQLNAQTLKEQYILQKKAQGLSSHDIAKQLGLKSQVTLEKYFN